MLKLLALADRYANIRGPKEARHDREEAQTHSTDIIAIARAIPDVFTFRHRSLPSSRPSQNLAFMRCEFPASIRQLTDTQCLELQLIENLQRADVHKLDEARGYAALMQLQPETYTVETLSEKIGRSEKYVYARLRLTHLVDEVQQAFYVGKLTVAHAFEIARLQPNDQRRALAECFPQDRTTTALLKDQKAEAVTVRTLREWIEREIHLDIANAPFDPKDEALLPAAGSCAACPKRTGNNPLLFPEIRHKSICTACRTVPACGPSMNTADFVCGHSAFFRAFRYCPS